MAKAEIIVSIKDNDDILNLLCETAELEAELIDLIPERMIEADEIREKLCNKWEEIIDKAMK